MDAEMNDMTANGLSAVLTRDGQGVPTANLPMAGFKHTGAGVATATGQYLTYGQSEVSICAAVTAAFGTTGTGLIGNAFTQTDNTTAAGTVASAYASVMGAPTLATAANAITITNAYGMYFTAPIAGSHVTLTNGWALGTDSLRVNGIGQVNSMGIGMVPVNPLDITKSQSAGSLASILNATTNAAAYAGFQALADETTGLRLIQTSTTYNTASVSATDPVNIASSSQVVGGRAGGLAIVASNGQLLFYSGSATSKAGAVATDGGWLIGNATPTGGSKGLGTINLGGGIYLNGTAYTNPDYVFEHWATGKIEKFADKRGASTYSGLRSLDTIRDIARKTMALPGFGQAAGHDLFSGSERLLEAVEEAYIHMFNMNDRIAALEQAIAKCPPST